MTSTNRSGPEARPDPVLLAFVRAPARAGMRMLAVDDLPIIDRPGDPPVDPRQWPLPLVASQAEELATGTLERATGDVVCADCGAVLAQRIMWAGAPAVIGLVRGHRWSRDRSWGRLPVSAIIAARNRTQWFCVLDRPTTPNHLPLACPTHGSMSVPAATVHAADPDEPLPVPPPR